MIVTLISSEPGRRVYRVFAPIGGTYILTRAFLAGSHRYSWCIIRSSARPEIIDRSVLRDRIIEACEKYDDAAANHTL